MNRTPKRGVPRVLIDGLPRKVPGHLQRVEIRNPKTGQIQTHSRQNAMDLVRLNGWVWVSAPKAQEDVTLADGRKVKGVYHGDAKAEAGQETRAEDKHSDGSDVAEVSAEVALDAESVSGEQSGASESDTEASSKLDELRAEAESLGVKVDKRWGLKRLKEEIADNPDNAL